MHTPSGDTLSLQANMVRDTSFAVLQEVLGQEPRKAWKVKTRHDLIVLDAKGELVAFLDDVQDMASVERREAIKSLVLGAAER